MSFFRRIGGRFAKPTARLTKKTIRRKSAAVSNVVEFMEKRLLFTTYYATAGVGGTHVGTAADPWSTLANIGSGQTFHSGDVVSLTGNFAASGESLSLGSADTGITITSNASSQAMITEPTTSTFISAINITTNNVTVSNLQIFGPGVAVSDNNYYGIYVQNTSTSAKLTGVTLENDLVSGFGFTGIYVSGGDKGTDSISIVNCNASNNQVTGIQVQANASDGSETNTNLLISGCITSGNTGDALYFNSHNAGANENASNGGIFIEGASGATVTNCVAFHNCIDAAGGVGIWAYQSTNVVFSFDESYGNTISGGTQDGDGFDFDHGTTNSIMEYNYAHDNSGAGFLLCTFQTGTAATSNCSGNTIRYCISDDDGQKNSYGGITLYCDSNTAANALQDANIYGNTILAGTSSSGTPNAVRLFGSRSGSITANFLNNVLYTSNGDPTLNSPASSTNLKFEGNDYYATGSNHLNIKWGSTTYSSLSAWISASSEETISSTTVGLNADPLFNVEAVSNLSVGSISNLELQSTSPLLGAGQNLLASTFSSNPPYSNNAPYNLAGSNWYGIGMQDFFGDPLVSGSAKDIGADQATVAAGTISFKSAGGGSTTVVVNSTTTDTVQFWLPIPYSLNVTTGPEGITVDASNGNPFSSSGMSFSGGSAYSTSNTLFLIGTSGNDTFASSSGNLTFNSVPIVSTNLGFTYLNPYGGTDSLTVTGGTLVLIAGAAGGGFDPRVFSTLSISSGAELYVQAPTSYHSDRQVIVAPSGVNISGHLDLTSNDMIVDSGNLAGLDGNFVAGSYLTTSVTSLATSAGTAPTTLGIIPNTGSLFSTFDGVSVNSAAIIIKWTFEGDANDSGVVDSADGTLLTNGYNNHLTGWYNGDFNYDGTVDNTNDLALYLDGYNDEGTTNLGPN